MHPGVDYSKSKIIEVAQASLVVFILHVHATIAMVHLRTVRTC